MYKRSSTLYHLALDLYEASAQERSECKIFRYYFVMNVTTVFFVF